MARKSTSKASTGSRKAPTPYKPSTAKQMVTAHNESRTPRTGK